MLAFIFDKNVLGHQIGIHVGRLLLSIEDLHFWNGVELRLYLALLHLFVLLLNTLLCSCIEWTLRLQDFYLDLWNIVSIFDASLTLSFIGIVRLAD